MRLLTVLLAFAALAPLAGCAPPLTLYTDADRVAVSKLVAPFIEKTGIDVDVVGFTDVHDLADSIKAWDGNRFAAPTKSPLFGPCDVVFSAEKDVGEALLARSALRGYAPDAAASIPAAAKNEGWWYGTGGGAWALAWNPAAVDAPPASLLDLAGFPAGSVAMVNPNYALFYSCGSASMLGADRMGAFLRDLAANGALWLETPEDTAEALACGRARVCLTTVREAERLRQQGAEVAWALPDQSQGGIGAYVQFHVVCVPDSSPDEARAKQLADWLLSPEAEKRSVELGLSDVTLRPCGSDAPVAVPLKASLGDAAKAMQGEFALTLVWLTKANPEYKGD